MWLCYAQTYFALISSFPVRSAKHGKPVVVTLQDKENKENMMPFDLATETTEELYEWYQVAWDITQREENREFEVCLTRLDSHTHVWILIRVLNRANRG